MIRSFRRAETESLCKGIRVRRFVNIEAVARHKLRQLEIASRLKTFGCRLEIALRRWTAEIVDYD